MCDEWARKFNKRESCVYEKSILDDMCIAYFSGYFDMIFIFNNTDQNKIRIYFIFVEYSFQHQTNDTEIIIPTKTKSEYI